MPGMAAANLVVKLDSDPGIAKSEMAEEKMKQSDQEVLEDEISDSGLKNKAREKIVKKDGGSL